jgi:5-methylcytosine-specific restriction protein A
MQHWIFISSTKCFRMNDWLNANDFVEYVQRNKVNVNDIVYLYTTAPICRIEYKMIVEKIDIPLSESVDDSAYDIRTNEQKNKRSINDKFIRLRLLKKVDNPKLHLDCLRAFGLKSSMQTNLKVSGDLLKYIEEQTK